MTKYKSEQTRLSRKEICKILQEEIRNCHAYRRTSSEHFLRYDTPSRHLYTFNSLGNKTFYVFRYSRTTCSNQWDDGQISILITELGDKLVALNKRKKEK